MDAEKPPEPSVRLLEFTGEGYVPLSSQHAHVRPVMTQGSQVVSTPPSAADYLPIGFEPHVR